LHWHRARVNISNAGELGGLRHRKCICHVICWEPGWVRWKRTTRLRGTRVMAGNVWKGGARVFLLSTGTERIPCVLTPRKTRAENKLCGVRFACLCTRMLFVVTSRKWVAFRSLSTCLQTRISCGGLHIGLSGSSVRRYERFPGSYVAPARYVFA
jgi:hypothetical protein